MKYTILIVLIGALLINAYMSNVFTIDFNILNLRKYINKVVFIFISCLLSYLVLEKIKGSEEKRVK